MKHGMKRKKDMNGIISIACKRIYMKATSLLDN